MDYYEAPAEGKKAALCPACGQIKPLSAFEQRITKAAAIERGYAGNVRVVHETTKCNACRPKKTAPRSRIPLKVLHNREVAGDVPRGTTEHERAQRAATLKDKQKKAGRKTAFDMHHKQAWLEYQLHLSTERQAVRMQLRNLKVRKHETEKPELFAFVTLYNNTLAALTARMSQRYIARESAPKHYWTQDLTEAEYRDLNNAWHDTPTSDKVYPTRTPRFYDTVANDHNAPRAFKSKGEMLESRRDRARAIKEQTELDTMAADSEELP